MRGAWSGDMLPRKNVLDFNALKCHSLGFRVSRTGYWPGFKVKAWKIYFRFLKVIQFYTDAISVTVVVLFVSEITTVIIFIPWLCGKLSDAFLNNDLFIYERVLENN